ncbi:MAG: hypothetical protein OM95_04935 [Bdellovibrio sp. ArHS]|nr:MAG: hypothetical protein OM95_04935 [Bdellovibrio sp. ArHS]
MHTLAAPNLLTYQGRIVKSDGSALEYNNVSFLFEITNNTGSCVIYREQKNGINMTNSHGVFDVPIGAGTKLFPSSPTKTLLNAFNNSTTHDCADADNNVAGTYTPAVSHTRLLRVQFHDGTGWKLLTPDNEIRTVPFAAFSQSAEKLGEHEVSDFVIKTGIPTCNASEFLTWNGSSLSCAAVTGASGGTVTNVTSANGYLTVTNNVSTPILTVNVGTSANTLAAGNDPRLSDARTPIGVAGGDLSGSYPNPTVAKIQGYDVASSAPTNGHFLKYDGAKWLSAAIGMNDVANLNSTLNSYLLQTTFDGYVTSANCAAHQTMYWSPVVGFQCQAINVSVAGDVSGTIGTVTVNKIKGVTVDTAGLTAGQVLKYDGVKWTPAADSSNAGTVTNIATGTGLSGGPITGTGTISLADTSVTAGSYTRANITVDAQGRLTSATNGSAVNLATEVTGALPIANGGTGATSLTANRLLASNVSGSAVVPFTCSAGQYVSFDATGLMICTSLPTSSYFIQNGNSFSAAATLGTNDAYALNFETTGTTRMTIHKDGYVGIGGAPDNTAGLMVMAPSATKTPLIVNSPASGKSEIDFLRNGTWLGTFGFAVGATNDFYITNGTNADIIFDTNNDEKVRLKADGRFGVGAMDPGNTFQVGPWDAQAAYYGMFAGSYHDTLGQAQYVGNWRSSGYWGLGPLSSTADNTVRLGNVSTAKGDWRTTQDISLVVGGKVGIGMTTAPTANLDVVGVTKTTGYSIIDSTAPMLMFSESDTSGAGKQFRLVLDAKTLRVDADSEGDGNFIPYLNPLTISPNGVTTTALETNGLALKPGSADHVYMSIYARTSAPAVRSGYFGYPNAGTNRLVVANEIDSGNIEFLTTSGGVGQIRMALSASGNLTTAGTVNGASDVRLKKDIHTLDHSLEKILQLRPASYHWKDPHADPRLQMGFIAQELEKIYPELVTENESTGLKAVSYMNMIAPLTQALQEFYREVLAKFSQNDQRLEKLESQMADLQKRNDELQKQNTELMNYLRSQNEKTQRNPASRR